MDFLNISKIIEFGVLLVMLMFSIIVHECSHGIIAYKCGDPTARMLGRITLNPIKHIDPFGTIMLPIMLRLFGLPPFGWAKPVPVNFSNLRHPKRDMIWVAAAGPGSNLMLATLGILLMVLTKQMILSLPQGLVYMLLSYASYFVLINVLLAVFNLMPIPPLDGSRIMSGLLPYRWAEQYSRIEPYGFLIIFVLIYLNAFDWVFKYIQLLTQFIINYLLS